MENYSHFYISQKINIIGLKINYIYIYFFLIKNKDILLL